MRPSLERFYQGGLWIKGVNGTLELIGAALLAIAPKGVLQGIVDFLLRRSNRISGLLSREIATLAGDSRNFAIFYLFSHGAVKVLLAVLLFRHVRAAFPVGIALFGALIAYEGYRLAVQPGILISAIVLLDLAVLSLILIHGPNDHA